MHFPSALIISLFCLFTASSALDLNLWTGNCGGSKVSCINAGYAVCCTGGRPFCTTGNCDGCFVGNDIYTFNRAACTGASYESCRAAVGNGCCRSAGEGNTCAIVAYVGNARTSVEAVDEEECVASVRPNQLIFTDDSGLEKTIFIPTGRFDDVAQYVVDEDWSALAEFPAWADQQYTEADITRKAGIAAVRIPIPAAPEPQATG